MGYDKKTGGFKSLGEFLVAVRKASFGQVADSRLGALIGKTMTEGTDSGGGFVVPEQFVPDVYHAALEGSIVRSRAIIQPMASDTVNIPILVDSDRSCYIFGGITFTWAAEAADKAALTSQPVLGQLKLTAHEGIAGTWVSLNLEKDVQGFEDFMKLAFGRAIRFYEDYYFIWGTGVNQPLGVMNSGFTASLARRQANRIVLEDIHDMVKRLLPGSWDTAIWLLNQSTLDQILSLDVVENNVLNVVDLNERKLVGFPFIVTEKCAALGTSGDIILADWNNGYVIGDRSLEVAASRETTYSSNSYGFLQNQAFWRFVLRVDGQTILSSAITPQAGGDTLSSFVILTDQTS